ncbi:hypothetical protein [Gemmobacter sp.]|uniref:Acb2/Tad1 domain-containing protein n=1 Tax=Gemmobacter sp. TaxID=1898957 RepID=UPI002AFF218B|nr:hypothetical protein [Gemmobacter sp.]
MTTKVTVHANHGWPVDVTVIHTDGSPFLGGPIRVPVGATRDFFVHSGADLRIHEVQPSELGATAGDVARPNTGLPVSGYRPQSDKAVAIVNENKAAEERILRKLDSLAQDPAVDRRWLAIARTNIEQGFMAMNRAVFQPGRVALPEDQAED